LENPTDGPMRLTMGIKGGQKMKANRIGVLFSAILMVVAGVGFGIAQAGGNQAEQPVSSFEDQAALGNGGSSSPYNTDLLVETGNLPEPGQAESAIVMAEADMYGDAQLRNPIETGSLPDRSDENDPDHSNVPSEGNIHQYWGSDNPSN